jgi:S-DNA-T family DNA segregation ATPase FtsK/SpoIIIE
MATKKKAGKNTKGNKINRLKGLRDFLRNRTNHAIAGILMIFTAVFLIGAFASYLFNGQYDQSETAQGFLETLNKPIPSTHNMLGKIGARAGHLFIYKWFGISAFLIGFLLLIFGIKVAFQLSLKRMTKTSGAVLFLLLWTPPTLAYLFSIPILAGGNGIFTQLWLITLLGKIGTAVILITSMLVFLAVRFKWTPERLNAWLQSMKPKSKATADETENDSIVEPEAIEPIIEEPAEVNLSNTDSSLENEMETRVESKDSEHELDIELPSSTPTVETEEESEEESADLEIEAVADEEELSDKDVNRKVKEFGEYDPKLDLSRFKLPTIDLLKDYGSNNITINQEELSANKDKIVETLNNYNIEISKIKATIGPTVTLYEIVPAAGVRISKIKNLEDDIALSLAALGIRIIAPIPGRGTIGIEVPNTNPQMVPMRNMLKSQKFQDSDMELPIAFGKTISNETFMADLAKMPHLLMAGATGQGKSVGLNVILTSILYKKHPSQVKFILVDPKKVELTLFNKIERHYLAKLPDSEEAIITDTKKVINTLNSLCIEMDNRYDLLKNAMCRNIKEYNQKFINRKLNPEEGHRYLPYIVLVIDEFADLIMTAGKEVETPIARLAQLARAIGIHLIVATQRPSVNVITGIIKANFPARAAFRVTSKIDSRTILDAGGADQLIGKGDMLIALGSDLIRVQCAFVDTPEVEDITDYIGAQQAYPEAYQLPEYKGEDEGGGLDALDPSDRDVLFEDAARVLVIHQQGSASLLQRKLKLGYNRAGRIIDQLEAAGIIGPFEGSKARQVLVPDEMALEQLLKNEKNL